MLTQMSWPMLAQLGQRLSDLQKSARKPETGRGEREDCLATKNRAREAAVIKPLAASQPKDGGFGEIVAEMSAALLKAENCHLPV